VKTVIVLLGLSMQAAGILAGASSVSEITPAICSNFRDIEAPLGTFAERSWFQKTHLSKIAPQGSRSATVVRQ